jgi:tyrosyl-tRNA synthetase
VACFCSLTDVEREFQKFKQKEVSDDIPEVHIELSEPIYIGKLMSGAELVASNSEVRRHGKQGGVKLNGEKIDNAEMDVESTGEIILQAGTRRFVRVFIT